ncbi:MAG: nuclear transport factor 2 family protein [Terracidiphilus sp.]
MGPRREYNDGMWNSAEAIAHAFVRAINRQDVEAMVALMAPGHRFVDSMGQVVEGREKVRACWVGYFRMVPDYSIVLEEAVCARRVVLMVGIAQGTYTSDGWLREENGWKTPAAFRASIADGKVAEWRVYADNEPMRLRMKTAM